MLRPTDSPVPTDSYSKSVISVMTSEELVDVGSVTPPAPKIDRFSDRVSHMTDRFVLSGSSSAYRIWEFRSATPPIEFPPTAAGWAEAWTRFCGLDSQAV